jgi:hypothetical protein
VTHALLGLVDLLPKTGALRVLGLACIFALLPIGVAYDVVRAVSTQQRRARALAAHDARCPAGHEVDVIGDWECEACSTPYTGSGFRECPACGAVAHRLLCPCGRALVNPLHDEAAR